MLLKSLARLTKTNPPLRPTLSHQRKNKLASISNRFLSSSDQQTLMDDPNFSVPISCSTSADDSFLALDAAPQIGSASGSFQSEGILSAGGGGGAAADGGGSGSSSDAEFGFQRTEFGQELLVGTLQIYDRHVFLCYKNPQVWPAHVEAAEFDRLPRLLSAALKSRKGDMKKRTRLTICEGEDGTESSNGDVLIFPDMIRYRRLTHFDVNNFVEEVLVKDTVWLPGVVETLTGSYVFVCSHGSRDRRCGVCGPALIKKFNEEILERGLEGQVSVSACSHIGGHKYAGNVIIFSQNVEGEVTGHWYGYVSPDDVPVLLEQHIGKGEVVAHLWRGQMGLSEEDQKKFHEFRLQLNGEAERETNAKEPAQVAELDDVVNGTLASATSCCQANGNSSCCQNEAPEKTMENNHKSEYESQKTVTKKSTKDNKGVSTRKICRMPTWLETWEREDTYAATAVVTAVLSVVVAYGYYRQLR